MYRNGYIVCYLWGSHYDNTQRNTVSNVLYTLHDDFRALDTLSMEVTLLWGHCCQCCSQRFSLLSLMEHKYLRTPHIGWTGPLNEHNTQKRSQTQQVAKVKLEGGEQKKVCPSLAQIYIYLLCTSLTQPVVN